jgi:hypothetical protein
MSDKKHTARDAGDEQVRNDLSTAEEKDLKKEAKEEADTEVLEAPADALGPDFGFEKELPENAYVPQRAGSSNENADGTVITPTSLTVPERFSPPFADEFHGVGGVYVTDPETGERKRVFEEVRDEKGKLKGYRPKP